MNTFLADFVDKVAEVSRPVVQKIGDRYYTSKPMDIVQRIVDKPDVVNVYSLDSVVKLVRQEQPQLPAPLFVHVESHDIVRVFSDFASEVFSCVKYKRFDCCYAKCRDAKPFDAVTWEYETALVALRSMFVSNEGTEYLLNLLSSVTEEDSAKSEDNGLSQTVTVKKGIALKERVDVKPRVALKPFRTFLEIEQPESEFLVRMLPEKQVHIREADGGMWKLEAKRRIAAYLAENLSGLIGEGKVIVMV